jgi:tetratricopeptide (TPR) repeat protein
LTRPVNAKVLPLIKEGYADLSKGANDKAIKILRKACTIDPECISGRRYLAYALVKQHEYKPALIELQKVSKLVPPNAFDFYLFGEAYYGANGMKQAHDCYNEALNQNKAYAAARVGLVKTFARQNKFEEAFNTLQEGMQSTNDEAVKKYYASLTKAVTEAQAESKAPTALVPATANTQIGSDAVKSAPVVLK